MPKILLCLLTCTLCLAEDSWTQVSQAEASEVSAYLQNLCKLGDAGDIDAFLTARKGSKWTTLPDERKVIIAAKVKLSLPVDLAKLKAAASSTEMVWQKKPALLQVQFLAAEDGDSVLVLMYDNAAWTVSGYKTKYKAP